MNSRPACLTNSKDAKSDLAGLWINGVIEGAVTRLIMSL